MRKVLIVLVLLIISCDRKSLDEQRDNLEKDYILNKLELQYYPSFSDLLGVEINFENEKLKLYNPTIDYSYVKLDSFNVEISPKDLIKINDIVKSISCDELENPKAGYGLDGMHLEAAFYFADGSIFHNSPGNSPVQIYDELKNEVLAIVSKYNKSSNNKLIIDEIKKYDEPVSEEIHKSVEKLRDYN